MGASKFYPTETKEEEVLREKAAKGDKEAQRQLARYFEWHHFDLDKAIPLYEQAAGQGDEDAIHDLAFAKMIKAKGGDEKALQEHKQWYEARKQQAGAQIRLGKYCHLVSRDSRAALNYYQQAAAQGHPVAQCFIAQLYNDGKDVGKDTKKVVECYEKAAAQGHPVAQYNLAFYYKQGEGVEKDMARAIVLYQKAAAQAYPVAQYNLALCYERGEGVPKDMASASALYHQAAAQGKSEASNALAICYATGEGVPKDIGKSIYFFQQAVDQGYAGANYNLALCYERGGGVSKDMARAISLYQKVVDQDEETVKERITICKYGIWREVFKHESLEKQLEVLSKRSRESSLPLSAFLNVSFKDSKFGETPLQMAIYGGAKDMITWLVAAGVSLHFKIINKNGEKREESMEEYIQRHSGHIYPLSASTLREAIEEGQDADYPYYMLVDDSEEEKKGVPAGKEEGKGERGFQKKAGASKWVGSLQSSSRAGQGRW